MASWSPPLLYSLPQRGKQDLTPTDHTVVLKHIQPPQAAGATLTSPLGPADNAFAPCGRPPTIVQLLLRLSEEIDPETFAHALTQAVALFPTAAGRREDGLIRVSAGLPFSLVQLPRAALCATPPPCSLFDLPRRHDDGVELLTVRLASATAAPPSSEAGRPTTASVACTVGVSFDHALCDVGGIAQLLAHVSAVYTGQPAPAHPHVDRSLQKRVATLTPARCEDRPRERKSKVPGGAVCVEWCYGGEELRALKADASAATRHTALFADVVALLSEAGHTPLATVSISKDERRSIGLPAEHFGNATSLVSARLPPMPSRRSAIAAAIRSAVEGSAVAVESSSEEGSVAHLHLNSWWHPLQRQMDFGCGAVGFGIGPGALASAARLCLARSGQPNVTAVPLSDGGVRVYLLAPLNTAQGVLRQLRQRANPKSSPKAPIHPRAEEVKPVAPVNVHRSDANPTSASTTSVSMPGNSRVAICSSAAPPPLASPGEIEAVAEVPRGHTNFSWLGDTPNQAVHLIPGSRLSPAVVPTHGLVWLHGLGDTVERGSTYFSSLLRGMPSTRIVYPKAPLQHVTAHQAMQPSWFDVVTWPVSLLEPEPPAGIDAAVLAVHRVIDSLVEEGLAASKVIVGGFSQGGSLAIAASLAYNKCLAGVVSISGWGVARKSKVHVHPANKEIPLFFSCGTGDPIVQFPLARHSAHVLQQILQTTTSNLHIRHVQRITHAAKRAEFEDAQQFMLKCYAGASAKHLSSSNEAVSI